MMDVLLTFTGFHDPYFKGLVDQEEQPGPILSLLSTRSFDHIFLFDTPSTQRVTGETKDAIKKIHNRSEVHVLEINLADPTNYQEIFRGLRAHLHRIIEDFSSARFFVAVASGTPHMHACWVLLTASGEIPARILHVRPPHFVTKQHPLVTEVDLSSREFPTVRFQDGPILVEESQVDADSVRVQLGIVGDHSAMQRSLEMGAMLAPSQAPVLIFGETGTGKELFARYIHRLSGRPRETFVAVNCAAIPEDLVESLLFGHKKGAFTGAINDQVGKFDTADKGTLFLDELGELPIPAQAKLLRVLQDGLVEPIGQAKAHKVDVRIVGATNRDLRKLVRQGKFREDLFYRLNVGEIKLPPLRERRSDIPKLALHILDRLNGSLRRPKRLSAEALSRLQSHNWAGNVRDLENVIERSTTLSPALKDKVLTCLSVLHDRHRMVRHPKCMAGDPGNDKEWLNLAFDSHDRIPFHAIVLSQPLIDGCGRECDALVEFFGSLDSAQWNGRRKRTLSLTKSDADYRAALAPILRHAKSLALIDPWLNSHESRYLDTVTICSNVLGQRGHARLQGRIDIHAEAGKQRPDGQTVADHLAGWEQKLRPLIGLDGHRFRVFLWESLPGSESMHDRFILTDQCGISAPGGLDCRSHSHANTTDWSLLDEDVRQRHWNEYDPPVSPFKLLGNREIS